MSDVTVTPIVECNFGLDGGAMFGIIPKPLWTRTNPADEKNRITLATRCLLLEAKDRRILVDVGMGTKWHGKEKSIYALELAEEGGIRASLRAHDVDPDTITDVVLTHLHFDHAGGLTWQDESGELRATFPDAAHWVQRENWIWAHHPSKRDAGSYRKENFRLLGTDACPHLELLDGVTRIVDDLIEVIPNRGHTPGMQLVKFTVSGETVVYVADTMPTLGHLQLPYVMGYDVYPLSTVREKHELLENAVNNDWIIALEHDPNNGFARVERKGPDKYGVTAKNGELAPLLER